MFSRRAVASALVLGICLAGCGGARSTPPAARPPAAARVPSASRAAAAPIKGPAGGLAIGLSEANANLLYAPSVGVPGPAQAPRDSLAALHPLYLRLDVDWAALQPAAGSPLALDALDPGCQRGTAPCLAYHGVRDELRALASEQRAGAGFTPVVVLYGVPTWAADPAGGCERSGTLPASRPIAPAALPAYGRLVSALIALGRQQGVELRWWSPWDEPNHPFFISPQRAACRTASPALAPGVYSALARELGAALHAAGGERHIVLGDFADFPSPRREGAGIGEFVSSLSADVVCSAGAWSVHEYPRASAVGGTPGGVRALERALDTRGACGRRARIWVTETGAGAPHIGQHRATSPAGLAAECRLMNRALLTWYRDPRVDVAFQYSFREDSLFPVGLATPGLDALYPAYYLWRAWGGTRAPDAAPPSLPAQCA